MDDTATKVLIGFIGVIGATALYFAGRNQSKIDLTISLYREYYSSEFGKTRYKAERFVWHNSDRNWGTWNPYEIDDSPDREGYSEIIRFFHRLAVLEIEGRLKRSLAAHLFSREYGWWDGYLFDRMKARTDWWTRDAILTLGMRLNNLGGYALLSNGRRAGAAAFADIPRRLEQDQHKKITKKLRDRAKTYKNARKR